MKTHIKLTTDDYVELVRKNHVTSVMPQKPGPGSTVDVDGTLYYVKESFGDLEAQLCETGQLHTVELLTKLSEENLKIKALEGELKQASFLKNSAYDERNKLIAFLSRLWPSHLCIDEKEEDGWQHVVCIHSPAGQLTWHIHDSDLDKFKLEDGENHWDGHTTEEKYRRLGECT